MEIGRQEKDASNHRARFKVCGSNPTLDIIWALQIRCELAGAVPAEGATVQSLLLCRNYSGHRHGRFVSLIFSSCIRSTAQSLCRKDYFR
jgi:hypothetical protein